MLISLLVKNIAIIKEVEVIFKDNLNILTGETGAGKSIIIDSVNIALGGKVNKEIIRRDKDYALVELVFETKDAKVHSLINELGIEIEENQVIISRKIMPTRSISRINGETVSVQVLREVGSYLLDIHGQHDNQSLLNTFYHLEFVDRYAKDEIASIKEELEKVYKEYNQIKHEYVEALNEEDKRLRELSFIEYELNEIRSSNLILGEDIQLEEKYKKLVNSHTIKETLQIVHEHTGYEDRESAGDNIGQMVKQLSKVVAYDSKISDFLNQLTDIEALLNDFNQDLSAYLSEMDDDYGLLEEISKRLDLLNTLKSKYGQTIEKILDYETSLDDRLHKYKDYDLYLEKLKNNLNNKEKKLEELSLELSTIRKKKALILTKKIRNELIELNFIHVKFEMEFKKANDYSANGYDIAEFIISTNPGEPLKPLSKVASGGELSRIMLGIKSVLADKDSIETLIFDEIDAGISGRTAQKVSEQLTVISKNHQVICITHLAQIAAMADAHFIIEKKSDLKSTHTGIRILDEDESIDELARIIGGVEITNRVKDSAIEMKELALNVKNNKNKV